MELIKNQFKEIYNKDDFCIYEISLENPLQTIHWKIFRENCKKVLISIFRTYSISPITIQPHLKKGCFRIRFSKEKREYNFYKNFKYGITKVKNK